MSGLAHECVGDPGGHPVVYLHGGLVGSLMWHGQRGRPGYFQVFVDLPGAGGSQHLRWRSMAHSADLVADTIRRVCPDGRAHVVGVSLGGDVGIHLVDRHPGRVASAVLSGMIVRGMSPWEARLGWWSAVTLKRESYQRMIAEYNGFPPEVTERLVAEAATLRHRDYLRMLGGLYRRFRLPRLVDNTVDVLVVGGRDELPVATESARELDRFPHVTGAIAPSSHSWQADHPGLFDEVVHAWITGARLDDRMMPFGRG